MSEDSPTRKVRVRRKRDSVQGLTFQEQADIQRAMYASLHVGRLQPVSSTDSRPIVHSQAAATVLTTTACPSTSAAVDNSDQPPPAKKKRGRPRKYPKAETTVPNAATSHHHLPPTTPNKPVLLPPPNPGMTSSPRKKKLPLLIDMSTFFDTSVKINHSKQPADSLSRLPRVAVKHSVVQSLTGNDSSSFLSSSSSSSTPALSPLESHMRSILGTTVTSSLNSEKRKNQERPRKLAMSASMKAPSEPNAGVKKAVTFHSKTVIVEPSNRTAVPCTSMVPLKSAFKSSGTPPDLIKIDLTNSADRSDSDTEQSVVPTVVETAAKPVQQTDRRDENDQSEVWHVDSTEDKPPPPPPNVPSTFQAQRKFAQNQNPPYQSTSVSQEKLCCPKEIPKTEDFIKYLCVRGATEDIPEELNTFNKPWTPKSARNKVNHLKAARPRMNTKPITSLKPLLSSLPAKKISSKGVNSPGLLLLSTK